MSSADQPSNQVPLRIIVILGTVRSERQGIKAARYVVRTMVARGHEAVSGR